MIKNYLKTALRIMLRQKAYSAINIVGLSIGMAATLLIIIYIADELSYDRMHPHAERIYRVGLRGSIQGNDFNTAVSACPVAAAMRDEIPEVAQAVRFGLWRTTPMSEGTRNFTEKRVLVADSNFFRFFAFPVVAGNPQTFLKGRNKLVITQSAARRYFGDADPIGKTLLRGVEKEAVEVTGVVKDPPHNSHIHFDMVLSSESWPFMTNDTQWTNSNIYTYVRLSAGADPAHVQTQLNALAEKNMGPELEEYLDLTYQQFADRGNNLSLFMQPLLHIHLRSDLEEEITPNGNIQYLYIFGVIAVFIILIACINFMNLSTARAANRAKEVGVRKAAGAIRPWLVFQFLAESIIYSLLSAVFALAIIVVSIDAFNFLSGKQLTLSIFSSPFVIAGLVVFTLITGLMAGSYPAFYLTAFKPAQVLKGKISAGFKNSSLRNALVVFQFIISIALIFGSLVVHRQLGFLQQKNLGFDKENVLNLLHTRSLGTHAQAFKNELSASPLFKGASFCNRLPPRINWNSAFRRGGSDQDYLLYVYEVDPDHLLTMGYQMAAGRFFSRDFKSDSAAIILNETAYRQMSFQNLDDAQVLSYRGARPQMLKVIGVLKDFNFASLKDAVKPLAILPGGEPNYEMAVRLAPGNTQEQIAALEAAWKKYAPGTPFEYSFLDQNFDTLFRAEQRMSLIILIFTVLAIGIACLGLFGLAAYTAEQRAKEIGIRKAMGASVGQVVVLMSRNFTVLVLIAFVIATPLAWYFAEGWLQGFAHRTGIDWSVVVISGVLALFIALFTISSQSLRAARQNPVKALQSE